MGSRLLPLALAIGALAGRLDGAPPARFLSRAPCGRRRRRGGVRRRRRLCSRGRAGSSVPSRPPSRSPCSCSARPSGRTQRSAGMCRPLPSPLSCGAMLVYVLPVLGWLVEPLVRGRRGRPARRACRSLSASSPRRPYGCSGWGAPPRAPGSTARRRRRALPRRGRSCGCASRFVMCARSTSLRKRSVARLIAALPRSVLFLGRSAALRMAAMSASSFAIARCETHCFGDVTAAVMLRGAARRQAEDRAARDDQTPGHDTSITA